MMGSISNTMNRTLSVTLLAGTCCLPVGPALGPLIYRTKRHSSICDLWPKRPLIRVRHVWFTACGLSGREHI